MVMGFSHRCSLLLLLIPLAYHMPCTLAATTHIVGGSNLWAVPTNMDDYSTWAAGETFAVGDTLVFNFTTGTHDVVQVNSAEYDACTNDSPIVPEITEGPATVTLKTAGMQYYICTIGTHCSRGQKVAIKVTTGGGATTPSTPTATTNTNTTTSPSPSGASAPLTGVAVVFFSFLSYYLHI